jgi:hypothetical protein
MENLTQIFYKIFYRGKMTENFKYYQTQLRQLEAKMDQFYNRFVFPKNNKDLKIVSGAYGEITDEFIKIHTNLLEVGEAHELHVNRWHQLPPKPLCHDVEIQVLNGREMESNLQIYGKDKMTQTTAIPLPSIFLTKKSQTQITMGDSVLEKVKKVDRGSQTGPTLITRPTKNVKIQVGEKDLGKFSEKGVQTMMDIQLKLLDLAHSSGSELRNNKKPRNRSRTRSRSPPVRRRRSGSRERRYRPYEYTPLRSRK